MNLKYTYWFLEGCGPSFARYCVREFLKIASVIRVVTNAFQHAFVKILKNFCAYAIESA